MCIHITNWPSIHDLSYLIISISIHISYIQFVGRVDFALHRSGQIINWTHLLYEARTWRDTATHASFTTSSYILRSKGFYFIQRIRLGHGWWIRYIFDRTITIDPCPYISRNTWRENHTSNMYHDKLDASSIHLYI